MTNIKKKNQIIGYYDKNQEKESGETLKYFSRVPKKYLNIVFLTKIERQKLVYLCFVLFTWTICFHLSHLIPVL